MDLKIIAHVNSKKPRVEKDLFGTLHIYVSEPPLEGRANKAIIASLAEYLHTPKSRVVLKRGVKSKQKIFSLLG